MSSSEIKNLIKFLQSNGGAVISGHNKFSVTPSILKDMNLLINTVKEDLYTQNMSTTTLINKYSASNELLFLYEFIKKTPKLKISNPLSSHDFTIDISDFTNLKYLELYKVNTNHVKGIQFLRENLEMIVCNRCLEKLCDVLTNGNPENQHIWSKLRHAVLSRNNIYTLDDSLIYTPWLQYLDISYNHITDLQPLACLTNLTYLDASFNNVKQVPVLNEFSVSRIKVLILRNNYITDVTGLVSMESLRECDLSENSLTDHSSLLSLSNLYSLLALNLSGNPLSYHPMHRSLTCGYLHENTANENFELDKVVLGKMEREFIRCGGKSQFNDRRYSNTDQFLASLQFATSSPSGNILESSISSTASSSSTIKKNKRIRDAVISEPFEVISHDDVFNSTSYSNISVASCQMDEPTAKHLETKKQIESLREQFGEDHWLHSKGACYIQDLLGIQKNDSLSDVPMHSTPPKISESFNAKSELNVTKIILEDSSNIGIDSVMFQATFSETSDSNQTSESCQVISDEGSRDQEKNDDDSVYQCSKDSDQDVSSEEEDTDEEEFSHSSGTLWPVKRVNGKSDQDIFLLLTDSGLKEIDKITSKLIVFWDFGVIERCIKICSEPVTLMIQFDVVPRKDRCRKYIMEYPDAQKLLNTVQAVLESKPLSALNQVVLRCMKCNALFCQEIRNRRFGLTDDEKYSCSSCGSTTVIEEDESVLPGRMDACSSPSKTSSIKPALIDSPSLSSIGSANSLNRSTENMNLESQIACQESDIEIMSNPSQSSIEVLEVYGRLNSDDTTIVEECSEITESTVELVPPSVITNSANAQLLTESSSSGSMTDSVCTTYESQSTAVTRGPHRMSQRDEVLVEEASNESSPTERQSQEKDMNPKNSKVSDKGSQSSKNQVTTVSNYTSLLEDLLHTVSSRLIASTPVITDLQEPSSSCIFEYSYTDFAQVDHRLKLYFYDKFFQENEHLLLLLKAERLYKSGCLQSYPGFFLVSTKKVYFLKIIGPESSDDLNLWIQKFDIYNVEKVKIIQPTIWKQGVSIEVDERLTSSTNVVYIILLLDQSRTDNFISFIKDLGTFHTEKMECENLENVLNDLICTDEKVRNFSLSESITISKDDVEVENFIYSGLAVTSSDLFIIKGELEWLLPYSQIKPSLALTEKMCNLVNVEMSPTRLILQFIDETEGEETSWNFKFVTETAADVIVDAIREPWQELFSVPLQMARCNS